MSPSSGPATIGKSVLIEGNVVASEDLTIEGTVQGKVTVQDHAVRVGVNGRIHDDVQAKSVVVAGEVNAAISANDRVEIASTGTMVGDVVAPRVVLADGARFKGRIDMSPSAGSSKSESRKPETETVKVRETAKAAGA